jgi:hypothetical protein
MSLSLVFADFGTLLFFVLLFIFILSFLFWPSVISGWRIHFRSARLRDLDLDDSRKRGHVDVHLEFLHSSNSPPPSSPAL